MFRHKLNRKGQNTAEYAILIALVVAGIVAMQTYAQRSLQARVKDSNTVMQNRFGTATALDNVGNESATVLDGIGVLGATTQYEPYYLESDYTNNRSSENVESIDGATAGYAEKSVRTRTGDQTNTYQGISTQD